MRTTELQPATATEAYRQPAPKKRNASAIIMFVLLWILLISGGVAGAKWYSDSIQNEVSARLEAQTAAQIAQMQQHYDARMTQLETDYKAQLAQMESKIESLNELLTFTKDNADTKTDNSNKLYTQLAEVKKQLAELKKSLDVLK